MAMFRPTRRHSAQDGWCPFAHWRPWHVFCLLPLPIPSKRALDRGEFPMLRLALFFFIVAIVAGLFGFTGISIAAADIAKIIFFVFIVLFLMALILGFTLFRAIP
jgi:uncharacterized membrane protein YtjA (UPF0391 family)